MNHSKVEVPVTTVKSVGSEKTGLVFLKGRRIVLRPILESDVPLLMKWINDPRVRHFVSNAFPKMEGVEREWVANLSKKSDSHIVLMIEVDGKPIGNIGVHGINWKDRTTTTGTLIGEVEYWGQGYGTDAKMTLLEYLFNTLNLRKVMSHVYAFNKRSQACNLRCGFKIEARLRKQRFVLGRYHDEIILGLFREDWQKAYSAYLRKLK